jgi:hypothetical protein
MNQTKVFLSNAKIKGWTERRLFDTRRFNIVKEAIVRGLEKSDIDHLLDWASKPMFKENALWRLFKNLFNLDLQIPFLFGYWTKAPITANTVTTVGKQISAQQVGGTTTAPVTAIALGVGTPTATALGSESTTLGGSRGAATVTNQTTTLTGDTEQWVKTFTFTGALVLIEEGLFDNNTSGGNMLASQTFSAVTTANTDTLQITHKVKYA